MKDGAIKQEGTSRLMRANLPATYEEFRAMAANGTLPLDIQFNAAGWQQLPTFLNKENLLKDETAALYGMDGTAVPDNVFERITHFTPTGAVFWLASETIPEGFLLCDGSSVSRTQYPALFSVIGTTFGSDDDETFKLPDLRAAFIRGAGSSGNHNATFGKVQEATALGSLGNSVNVTNSDGVIGTETARNGTLSLANPYSINKQSVRPYNIALTPIIKYY